MSEEDSKDLSKVAGGKARAKALSADRRSEIGRWAAESRWQKYQVGEAIKEGMLEIGGVEMPCFVLADETRVLARSQFVKAIGRTGKVKGGRKFEGELQTPVFLTADNLKPFINSDIEGNSKPIIFEWKGTKIFGYRAELLPDVCDVYSDAERAGALRPNQKHIAEACRILGKGLTRIGIIGLIDEATGYQKDRAADALSKILEAYIAKELQPWVKTFPDQFYEQLFRLQNLEYPTVNVRRPQYFGHITNDIIYKRLAPGVLEELKNSTPKNKVGRPKKHLHRRLTPELGHPKLREHLSSVITIMKLSNDWDDFKTKLDVVHRKFSPQGDMFNP